MQFAADRPASNLPYSITPVTAGTPLRAVHGFNTLLASSPQFKREFAQLRLDHSTGVFKSSLTFDVPESFDGRVAWKPYFAPVRNQGKCGSCWAFAATTALQMRLAIATDGKYNLILSPAKMVVCNMGGDREIELAKAYIDQGQPYDYLLPSTGEKKQKDERDAVGAVGCNGETLIGAWQFLYRFGVPEESCMKYEGGRGFDFGKWQAEGGKPPACSELIGDTYDRCPDGSIMELHLSQGFYHVPGATSPGDEKMGSGSEADIRRDIFHWGPCTTGFSVHEDFMRWDGKGVYDWDGTSPAAGGHAVVIVGWGVEGNKPYWIVRNSWGPGWGDGGYFKIARGKNCCEIEENIITGVPDIIGFRLFLEWPLLNRFEDLALRAMWGVEQSGYKTTIYEEMLMGIIPPEAKVFEFQYAPDSWPDVSKYVAGIPSSHVYRLAGWWKANGGALGSMGKTPSVLALAGGAAVIVAAGAMVYFYVKKKKQ
jgi:hypothetical protein